MAFQATFCIVTTALVSGAVVERMRFGAVPRLRGAVVGARLRGARALGVRRRLAAGRTARSTSPAACRSRWARASRRSPRRSSSARARTTGARRSCPTTPSTCCSARACCGSAGSASTAAAASRPATPSVLAFTNTLLAPGLHARRLVRARPAPRPAGHGDRRGDGDHRRLRRRSPRRRGYISPGWAMVLGALAALPSYAMIVLAAAHAASTRRSTCSPRTASAGFTGILFIGFFAQTVVERRRRTGCSTATPAQLGWQALAALAAPAYAFAVTYVLLGSIGARACRCARTRARGGARAWTSSQHGEEAYATGEGAILVFAGRLRRGRREGRTRRAGRQPRVVLRSGGARLGGCARRRLATAFGHEPDSRRWTPPSSSSRTSTRPPTCTSGG